MSSNLGDLEHVLLHILCLSGLLTLGPLHHNRGDSEHGVELRLRVVLVLRGGVHEHLDAHMTHIDFDVGQNLLDDLFKEIQRVILFKLDFIPHIIFNIVELRVLPE